MTDKEAIGALTSLRTHPGWSLIADALSEMHDDLTHTIVTTNIRESGIADVSRFQGKRTMLSQILGKDGYAGIVEDMIAELAPKREEDEEGAENAD